MEFNYNYSTNKNGGKRTTHTKFSGIWNLKAEDLSPILLVSRAEVMIIKDGFSSIVPKRKLIETVAELNNYR